MFVGICPVVGPVSVDPNVAGVFPSIRAIAFVIEASAQLAKGTTVVVTLCLRVANDS